MSGPGCSVYFKEENGVISNEGFKYESLMRLTPALLETLNKQHARKGDRIRIDARDLPDRHGHIGTILEANPQGAMVRFGDGKRDGFKYGRFHLLTGPKMTPGVGNGAPPAAGHHKENASGNSDMGDLKAKLFAMKLDQLMNIFVELPFSEEDQLDPHAYAMLEHDPAAPAKVARLIIKKLTPVSTLMAAHLKAELTVFQLKEQCKLNELTQVGSKLALQMKLALASVPPKGAPPPFAKPPPAAKPPAAKPPAAKPPAAQTVAHDASGGVAIKEGDFVIITEAEPASWLNKRCIVMQINHGHGALWVRRLDNGEQCGFKITSVRKEEASAPPPPATANPTQAAFASGDRVKVTTSVAKLKKDFPYSECVLDGGPMTALGRTMTIAHVFAAKGYAKVTPAANSDFEYEHTFLPLSCLKAAKPIPVKGAGGGAKQPNPAAMLATMTPAATPSKAQPPVAIDAVDLSDPPILTSPVKKPQSSSLKIVCKYHLQGKCKYGHKCHYLHLPPAEMPPLPEPARAQLLNAAGMLFSKYYKHAYAPKPPSCTASDADYYNDHDAAHGVERPNHGLAHSVRKALYVPEICRAFGFLEPLQDTGLLISIQMALLFEVCGRQSEIGFNECTPTYMSYKRRSIEAYEAYAQGFEWYDGRCVDALNRMYDGYPMYSSRPIQRVIEVAHDLDLFRCYPEEKMWGKVQNMCSLLGTEKGMALVLMAESAIHKTGDRIMCSFTGLRERDDFLPEPFRASSRDASATIQLVASAKGKATAVEKYVEKKPETAPPMSSAGSGRSLKTTAFLPAYDNAKMPKHLYQLQGSVDGMLKTYARRHGIPEAEVDEFFESLQEEANRDAVENGDEVFASHAVKHFIVRMWTSPERLREREFCAILNELIRGDEAAVMDTVSTVVRSLNRHCVTRTDKKAKCPGKTFRGTTLPKAKHIRGFFQEGKKFRAPMFLATSSELRVAERFMRRAAFDEADDQEPTLWIFHFDDKKKCNHINYLEKTAVEGESEWLFAPYSAFEVISVKFVPSPKMSMYEPTASYHEIHLRVAPDNFNEPLDLSLSPWG
jgi:hypothetical protein